jgi:type II secretory ATPase GspE/PulE/Tfp pilus assembly ATPase PilB-like protein
MDPFNFADALLGVLAQRLVRTFRKDCKKPIIRPLKIDSLVRTYDGDFGAQVPLQNDLLLYRPKAAPSAEIPVTEGEQGSTKSLWGQSRSSALIQGRAKMEEIRAQAIQDGMTTLMPDGIRKVL